MTPVARPWTNMPPSRVTAMCAAMATLALAVGMPGTASEASLSSPSPVVEPGEPWIAYVWDAQGVKVVRMVRPDGSDDHLAIGGALVDTEHPDWSPDGTRIAYQVDWHEILAAHADGSDPVTVASCVASCIDVDMPAWSPDGNRNRLSPGGCRGWLLHQEHDRGHRPGHRPDHDRVRAHCARVPRLATMGPDGQSMVVELERYQSDPVPVDSPGAWTSAIAVVDLRQDPAAAPRVISSWDVHAAYPDWSPTDGRIVFGTYDLGEFNETEEASNLFTVRPDGSELTQLTSFDRPDDRATQPFWTPDGQRIIFTWVARDGYHDAQVGFIDADGGNLTRGLQETTPVYVTHPRLRPTP